MRLPIRHLYRKTAIYGTLLATCILITIGLMSLGIAPGTIVIVFGILLAAGIAAYMLYDPIVSWRFDARIVDMAMEPRLDALLRGICERRGSKTPRLAVLHGPEADLFVGGATKDRAVLFYTPQLLAEFDDPALATLLAWEMAWIDEMGSFPYNLLMVALALPGKIFKARGNAIRSIEGEGRVPPPAIDIARVSDVPAVVRLLVAHDMYNYYSLHDLVRLARSWSPLFLVARDAGRPVGFIIGEMGTPGNIAHITKLVIDGRYRRRGIGSRLLRAFIGTVERSGCRDCRIDVRINNRGAISLYEKFEFKEAGVLPGHYPDGTGCLVLVKSLATQG